MDHGTRKRRRVSWVARRTFPFVIADGYGDGANTSAIDAIPPKVKHANPNGPAAAVRGPHTLAVPRAAAKPDAGPAFAAETVVVAAINAAIAVFLSLDILDSYLTVSETQTIPGLSVISIQRVETGHGRSLSFS